ncbi:LysM peptidoglycan-binding domain-containing protein [Colwellia sp. Arc7-635]|uniref:LysM peptidoglycan-binding domain-containing protein n=1 Tax=Colwellia sp. Arc7-635 TaxID=2497879 RepID=UPI000F8582A8|nr:LysM peptidoglycan-binding domain-containing protein [Colwellia sp. Arc7-635]AZQ84645.1 LysM peptidoglycan-binding domain-containing protein [Colwellia sp. Arc7-635]
MKYITLSIATVLLMSGCQSILNQDQSNPLDNHNENQALIDVASANEINQALLVDEAIDVIHPIADGNVDLGNSAEEDYLSNDVWQRIRSNLELSIPDNPRIASQRAWFLKHPSYLNRVAKRAEPFLYYIVEALEANNIPVEIALLPIVESAFDPFAYSHGRASGMWQFVPGTGKRFGMKQNWWYDGRRDVVASTEGAIQYLQYLHKFFDGDWMLALAAYNSGEGRVRRAVRSNKKKNLPTDFWSLDLPKETRDYVPKLLALADIVKRSDEFKIKLLKIDNNSVISRVDIGSQLDLAKAAQLAKLTLTELQRLNPGFNRWATDPDGPHYLLLPNHKIADFKTGLAKLSKKERLAWQRYQIKSGDSLGKIAQKFNTEIALIKQVNNVKGNQIRAGKFLLIPVATASLDSYLLSQNQRLAKTQNKVVAGEKRIHIVKSGDTLWDLSRSYKVSTRSIAKWNGMAPRDTIKPGQKLVIWQKTAVNTTAKNSLTPSEQAIMRNITYRVRKGDSFARIASKFNVSITDIERWNSLNRKKYLQPGQMLKLSVDVTNNI